MNSAYLQLVVGVSCLEILVVATFLLYCLVGRVLADLVAVAVCSLVFLLLILITFSYG